MKDTCYLLDHRISWKTFKLLHDRFVQPDGGPEPVHMDKVLWQMLRDRQIYCWYSEDMPGDMGIGLEVPKNMKIIVLSNPKPTKP